MGIVGPVTVVAQVALRKESVDRNNQLAGQFGICGLSLSARRAWIEMESASTNIFRTGVALRKESVDRNH